MKKVTLCLVEQRGSDVIVCMPADMSKEQYTAIAAAVLRFVAEHGVQAYEVVADMRTYTARPMEDAPPPVVIHGGYG